MYQGVLENLEKGKIRLTKNGDYKLGPWAIFALDGVVTSTKHIKRGEKDYGVPLDFIKDMLHELELAGYKTLLFTTRKVSMGVIKYMRDRGLKFEALLSFETKKNPEAGMIFLDDQTLEIDEDDPIASLELFREFLANQEKITKVALGRTVREATPRKTKLKESTLYSLREQILPINIIPKIK